MKTERWICVWMASIAMLLFVLSTVPSNQEAFVFPRIVGLILIAIAAAAILGAWDRSGSPRESISVRIPWRTIWPALVVFLVYLNLAETLGFYTTSLLAFVALSMIYSPAQSAGLRLVKSGVIAGGFIAALYVLFTLLLRVQMP